MIDNRCYQKCQQITAVEQYLLTKVMAWRTPMQVTSIQLLYVLRSNAKVTAWRTPMLVTSIQLTVYTVFHRRSRYCIQQGFNRAAYNIQDDDLV